MSNLYDKNREYVGWKDGKPYWKNHGQHKPCLVIIDKNGNKSVVCEVCQIELLGGEYEGEPKDYGWKAGIRLTNNEGRTSLSIIK